MTGPADWSVEDGEPDGSWRNYLRQMFPTVSAQGLYATHYIATVGHAQARYLWQRRCDTLDTYLLVYGPNPARWPHQHPTVVFDEFHSHHAACLRCLWLSPAHPTRTPPITTVRSTPKPD